MLTLGLRIKKLREIRGYSQDFMAFKLKISQEQYSYLENKQKNIREEHIQVIASLLEISVEDLRSFDPANVIKSPCLSGENEKVDISKSLLKSQENEIEVYRQLIKTLNEEIVWLKQKLK